jgi:hypothetical protein
MRIAEPGPIADIVNINILAGVAVIIFCKSAIHGYLQKNKVEAQAK